MKRNKVFIIAEAGVNHNGSLAMAKKMIDVACRAGADAVKFQTFKTEELVSRSASLAKYQIKSKSGAKSQSEMLKKLELSYDEFSEIKEYCDRKNIIFLSTPFDYESVDFLENMVPLYKIASGELTNIPLLKYIAKKNKPIILSTGMATLKEVECAVNTIRGALFNPISRDFPALTLLHCTTSYPCDYREVNLKAIKTLKDAFNVAVGYSDHTLGIEVSIAAVALGAEVIEKHFTLDKNYPGPDHSASLEPLELKRLVEEIRKIEVALGDGIKKPQKSELEAISQIRRSLHTVVSMRSGEKITKEKIRLKRPGQGIPPKEIDSLIGKRLKRDMGADELISMEDIKAD